MITTIEILREEIRRLSEQIIRIQDACQHVDTVRVPRADTGNYCKADDSYWYEYTCKNCDKYWIEPQ